MQDVWRKEADVDPPEENDVLGLTCMRGRVTVTLGRCKGWCSNDEEDMCRLTLWSTSDSAAIDSVSEPVNETFNNLAGGGGSIPPATAELFFEDAFEDRVDMSVLEAPPPPNSMDFLFDLLALWFASVPPLRTAGSRAASG